MTPLTPVTLPSAFVFACGAVTDMLVLLPLGYLHGDVTVLITLGVSATATVTCALLIAVATVKVLRERSR